jgi:Protein of unknown function (DUF3489)
MSALPPKADIGGASGVILGCSGSPSASNKIIQKGLAFSRRQSGTVPSSGRWLRFGILPCRLDSRGGASVVAAMVAAKPKEIPMIKSKPKRKPATRPNDSKITTTRNGLKRATAHKAAQLKPVTKPAIHQRPRFASQPIARRESKKALIIAMLRAPDGATIEAMARAANWQPHSVRGFLAGVVRKKLGLTLVSAEGEKGRVYRITDRTASAAA